ncbi:uncharacterized protein [Eurosta solidaginis]|uniref:uncharacterized protein isoform X3 n=1 Tax=Eurosta solidaginis TaxID=178769 RepID=UPI0035311A58
MSHLECCICLEDFKDSREIHSTDCGHIFHKDCLEQCKDNLPAFVCPQCRHPNPTSHKIYLSVEQQKEIKEEMEMLKLEPDQGDLKVKETEDTCENKKPMPDFSSLTARNFLNEPTGMKAIIIKGVSKDDIKTPLIETVFMLSKIMNISCTSTDIEAVFILDRKFFLRPQNQNEKLNIVVKFTTLSFKNMFLDRKEVLKDKGIILNEFVDEDTNEVFLYARSLQNRGYKNVFCRNNGIFVQKDDGDILHHIYSKQDVDNML